MIMAIWVATFPKMKTDETIKLYPAPLGWKFARLSKQLRVEMMAGTAIYQDFNVQRLIPNDASKDVYWNGGPAGEMTEDLQTEINKILCNLVVTAKNIDTRIAFVWYTPNDRKPVRDCGDFYEIYLRPLELRSVNVIRAKWMLQVTPVEEYKVRFHNEQVTFDTIREAGMSFHIDDENTDWVDMVFYKKEDAELMKQVLRPFEL
jgi:hypothetical protein